MSNGRCLPQPLLIEAGDRLKLRVFVYQGGAALEGRRRDPGIGQGEAMAGFEFSCAQQQGLGGLQPVDRQGLELLIGQAASPLAFIFPDPVARRQLGRRARCLANFVTRLIVTFALAPLSC